MRAPEVNAASDFEKDRPMFERFIKTQPDTAAANDIKGLLRAIDEMNQHQGAGNGVIDDSKEKDKRIREIWDIYRQATRKN